MEFYENWAALYPQGRERELLLQLAEVERRHKAHVEAMFTNAAFPEVWE
jgi:rubrerythrin